MHTYVFQVLRLIGTKDITAARAAFGSGTFSGGHCLNHVLDFKDDRRDRTVGRADKPPLRAFARAELAVMNRENYRAAEYKSCVGATENGGRFRMPIKFDVHQW